MPHPDAEQPEATEAIPIPSPTAPAEPLSMGAVLKIAPMRRLWYAQIVSVFGDFLALYAVISVMTFRLHATPQQVTGVNIAYLLPIAVLGILSGVFVDRWPVKPTLVASDLTRACLCGALLFVHSIFGFYIVLAAISVFSSFFNPAQGVAIRSIVPLHGLRSANALMQQVMFIMRIVGPGVAGFLVNRFTPRSCYWADAISFVASGTLITSVALRIERKPAAPHNERAAIARIGADMREGASFIVHHAGLLFVIVALAAAMFVMGCFGPLIAVYVRDDLHRSVQTFSYAAAMIGIGLLFGVNLLNAVAKHVSNTVQVYAGLIGIACGVGLMAIVAVPFSAFAGCFVIGFTCAGIIVPSQTMLQMETPPALLGRVGSTTMSTVFGAQVAGLLLSGVLAERTSVRGVFGLSAVMLLALVVAGKVWMEPKAGTVVPA
jgi:DHA3 family macrolide efflux protein-like MFS transporter